MNKLNIEPEYTFKALKILEKNSSPTQRELSSNLNLSLGKINFLIRSLAEKGWIKVERFKNSKNKSAYLYYLTPKGFEEKARLTSNYLARKIQEYEKLEVEISRLKKELDESEFPKKV